MNTSPLWHPFTQHKTSGPMIAIERAQAACLYTRDGTRIIDAISSWWVNTHGHCHPKIVEAVKQQAEKLDQVIFAGFTHDPAERLAQELLRHAGVPLSRVFLSDSGSTAVEVALKMAIGYWHHKGEARSKIVALEHGYHGDTFGAMAAGARGVFSKIYEPYLFEVTHIPFPSPDLATLDRPLPEGEGRGPSRRSAAKADGKGEGKTLEQFESLLQQNDIAALIVEPLVLGAGGMKMYGAETLRALYDLCRQHNVLFIADEVMTGFGRTGTMFACQQAGFMPDLLCLSKGITGGLLPLGATLAREDIYQAFYHDDRSRMFFHSSSFTGNPLSCAAACAALAIWEEEPVTERIQTIIRSHQAAAQRFAKHQHAINVRQCGTILALDVQTSADNYLSPLAPQLYEFFMNRGLLLRPLGNTVYIMPPYCITQKDLNEIYDGIAIALDRFGDAGRERAA